MSDVQTMKQMIDGLKQKKKNLQTGEAIFLKLSGINEEIEKASQDKAGYEEEMTDAKKRRDKAKKQKSESVAKTTSRIESEMNAVLPFGEAVFSYDEDEDGKRSMEIGWDNEMVITPYNGLSGGEKQIFDAALANVLDANIIIVEAAELDDDNFKKTLFELAKLDKQVLVNTCHPIGTEIPETFKIIEV